MVDKKSGFQNHKRFAIIVLAPILVLLGVGAFIVGTAAWDKPGSTKAADSVASVESNAQLPVVPKGVAKDTVVNLNGRWTAKINQTTFNVDVTETTVTIKMENKGNTLLYWYGSFSGTTTEKTVVSNKLDIDKAVLSGASSKDFSVGDSTLTFEVSAMGQTRNVEVHRVG